MVEGFYSRLADFVLRRRWWVLASYGILTCALGWLGSRITLRTDISDLLPEGSRSADDLRLYLDRFGPADTLFLVLMPSAAGATPEADALEEAASRLTEELEATQLFRSVRYGFSEEEGVDLARRAMAHFPVLIPPEKLSALAEKLRPDSIRQALTRIKSSAGSFLMMGPRETLAAEDPLNLLSLVPRPAAATSAITIDVSSGLFLSPDGGALLVVARPLKPPQDVDFSKELLAAVEGVELGLSAEISGVRIDHAGGYLFAVQDEGRIRHDIITTSTISMAAIVGLFALVLRRFSMLLILLVPLALSTLWTLGVAAIYPGHLNVVTVAFAAILLGMGDDSLTHLYLRAREEATSAPDRAAALRSAMVATGPSILVATLTSGLAFASLTFVEFRGLSELGLIAAIGMLNLLISVFLLFPCLLSLSPAGSIPSAPLRLPMGPFVAWHRWAMKRRTVVLACAAALVIGAGASCTRLQFSSDFRSLRGKDEAQARLDRLLAPFAGAPDPIHLLREASSPEEALRAAEALDPLCSALKDEGFITGCASTSSWLPSETTQRRRFALSSRIAWDQAARELTLAAEQLGLQPRFFSPFFANLARYGRWEETRLSAGDGLPALAGVEGISGSTVAVSLFPAAGQSHASVLARARQIDPVGAARAASIGLVAADLTAIIQNDFHRASLIALAAVALITLAAFRSPSRLLLVAIPVVVGCVVMLGGLALLRVPINLMNLVATPIVFGLGIDFSVYLVNRHLEEGCADIPKVLRETGGAILLTGLTTLVGFGSLLAADFAGLRSMGWVAVFGIGGCLFASLLILPLLLPKPS
jgi:predicted exporter